MKLITKFSLFISTIMIFAVFLTACGSTDTRDESDDNFPTVQPKTQETDTNTDNNTPSLKKEYQDVMNEISTAMEAGFSYDLFGVVFTRKGDMVKNESKFMNTVIGKIGQSNNVCYHFTIEDNEITEKEKVLFEFDLVSGRLDHLIKIFYAHSNKTTFNDGFIDYAIKDVLISQSDSHAGNPSTVFEVISHVDGDTSKDDTVETFTIFEGMLESYSISTPYVNQGQLQVHNYEYLSRGPIDDSEFELFYELKKD